MRPIGTSPPERVLRGSSSDDRVASSLERHAMIGWYEWTLREFMRYVFGVAVLGVLVFVPLQMELSWLPTDAPPTFDPTIVVLFAVLALLVIGAVAILAYRRTWGDGGWVDRTLAHHRMASRPTGGPPSGRS